LLDRRTILPANFVPPAPSMRLSLRISPAPSKSSGHFRSVIVLGWDDLDVELAELGMAARVKSAKRTADIRLRRPDISDRDLDVSESDRAWFAAENQLDNALLAALQANRSSSRDADAARTAPFSHRARQGG